MTDAEMSESRYRTPLEESNDIATLIDTDGTMTYVSPAVRRVLGYEPDELIGTAGNEYVHPDDRERNAEAVEAVRTNAVEPHGLTITVTEWTDGGARFEMTGVAFRT